MAGQDNGQRRAWSSRCERGPQGLPLINLSRLLAIASCPESLAATPASANWRPVVEHLTVSAACSGGTETWRSLKVPVLMVGGSLRLVTPAGEANSSGRFCSRAIPAAPGGGGRGQSLLTECGSKQPRRLLPPR